MPIAKAINTPRPTAPPTAMPIMAPVLKPEDDAVVVVVAVFDVPDPDPDPPPDVAPPTVAPGRPTAVVDAEHACPDRITDNPVLTQETGLNATVSVGGFTFPVVPKSIGHFRPVA